MSNFKFQDRTPSRMGSNVGDIPDAGLRLGAGEKFVYLHGDQIVLTSEVGVGTTFTVTLLLGRSVE